MNREEMRDTKARECGYRNWEHLIQATRNEPMNDVATMTGYSAVTVGKWRRKLDVGSGRADRTMMLRRFDPPMTECDKRNPR